MASNSHFLALPIFRNCTTIPYGFIKKISICFVMINLLVILNHLDIML